MPRQYPIAFRDEMIGRMLDGESVLELVSESGMPMQTLHRWKHQALIDAGLPKEWTRLRVRPCVLHTSESGP